jgi:predicted AAA+ superfamily ATPase
MERNNFLEVIQANFAVHPIVAILGPRQCGKTTLAREFAKGKIKAENYFDLEDPADLLRLENPKTSLSLLSGLIVIDEIQRSPELFTILRVLIDRDDNNLQILILGSASRDLINQSSETLAGRIGYIELTPFNLSETHDMQKLWYRGGYPRSYLAISETASYLWRKNYILTFLERDIPSLGFNISAKNLHRFWMMLTAYHGNFLNASELGNALQLNYKTVQSYVDLLHETFMIRVLQPWFENITKRQVKSPKIYFRDSGIFHSLLGIDSDSALTTNTKIGVSWEGFAVEEIIRLHGARNEECYFWSTQSQPEIDLLIFKNAQRLGYEFKYTDAPKITKSMQIAYDTLKLDKLSIVYPGNKSFKLTAHINVIGLSDPNFTQICAE